MDTAVLDEKEVICWQSDNSVRYVEVDRVTTVWPDFCGKVDSFNNRDTVQKGLFQIGANYSIKSTSLFLQSAHIIKIINKY